MGEVEDEEAGLDATFDEGVNVDEVEDEEAGSMAVTNVRIVSTDERVVESGMDAPFVRTEEAPLVFGAVEPLTFVLPVWVEPLL